jgi:hypothetical protein
VREREREREKTQRERERQRKRLLHRTQVWIMVAFTWMLCLSLDCAGQ